MTADQVTRLSDRQACILRYLTRRHRLSCNSAGDLLARAGLLRRVSRGCSNFCLPGAAVLRSLERRGLLHRFSSSRDRWAISLFALSPKGREVAESLEATP